MPARRLRVFLPAAALALASLTAPLSADFRAARPQVRFRHFGVEQGLAGASVRTVLQDSKGFLWIGTPDGLSMFDGFRFTLYKNEPDNPNSLPASYVTSIVESNGPAGQTLWIGTYRGLAAFDVARQRFTRYGHDPKDPSSLSHDAVQALLIDRTGVLWAGTSLGINRFDPATGRFSHLRHDPANPASLSANYVTALREASDGALWVGTAAGLNRLDPRTGAIERFVHGAGDPGSLNDDYVRSLLIDTSGRLWIGTDKGGLDRFDPASRTFVHHVTGPRPGALSGNSVNAVMQDSSGDIWVGVWGGGVNRLVEEPGAPPRFEALRHVRGDPQSLSIDDVNVLAEDRSGAIWVGTYNGGLNSFTPALSRRFAHYKHVIGDPGSIRDDRVYALLVDRSRTLWVGTWGGISRLREGEDRFVPLAHDPADPDSLSGDRVTSFAQGADGAVWIGTMDAGVNRVDPATGRITRYRHSARAGSLGDDRITTVFVDRDGALWAGTLFSGLNRLNADGTFTVFPHERDNPATLSDPRVNRIAQDRDGRLWIATNGGLNLLDPRTSVVTRIQMLPGTTQSMPRRITDIVQTADGDLWAGTGDGGIVRMSLDAAGRPVSFRGIREKDGLASDRVYRIIPDAGGRLWVTTEKGMTAIDVSSGRMRTFDRADGLQSDQFLDGGWFDQASGTMLIGGVNGLNTFRPGALGQDAPPAPVVLTDFLVLNRPIGIGEHGLTTRIADAATVTLPYSSQMFSIEFATLDLAAPQKTTYAYMLEGFDEQWHSTGASRRFATYTHLNPGTYTFVVRTANRDGVWSPAPARLAIVIPPPFWMTWWFRTAAVALSVLTLLLLMRARFASMQRHRRLLEQEVETRTAELVREKQKVTTALEEAERANAAKTAFLANMSHEMRTPLGALVGLADVLQDTTLDAQQREYVRTLAAAGQALSELVDDTLDLRKIELDRFELEQIPFDVDRIITETIDVVRIRAQQKGLQLACSVDQDVPREVVGDPRALRRVLMNLLGNAVKFTESGGVALDVKPGGGGADHLRFTVSDTGIGIPSERQEAIFDTFVQADASTARRYGGSGLGLAISRQLVQLMGGQIWVESSPGKGSRFHFTVPLRSVADARTPAVAVTAPANDLYSASPLRLLVVEDSPHNRLLMRAYLQGGADAVDMAESAEEAIERFRTAEYDVVLMDVNLPGMDGYAATTELRAIEAELGRVRTAIISLTAFAFAEDAARSRAAGCDEHLTKPIRKSVLLQTLNRYRTGPRRLAV